MVHMQPLLAGGYTVLSCTKQAGSLWFHPRARSGVGGSVLACHTSACVHAVEWLPFLEPNRPCCAPLGGSGGVQCCQCSGRMGCRNGTTLHVSEAGCAAMPPAGLQAGLTMPGTLHLTLGEGSASKRGYAFGWAQLPPKPLALPAAQLGDTPRSQSTDAESKQCLHSLSLMGPAKASW